MQDKINNQNNYFYALLPYILRNEYFYIFEMVVEIPFHLHI
jgi:hypothetical protein